MTGITTRNLLVVLFGLFVCATARGGDWPTWRYDAQRTAASPEQLGDELGLLWWRGLEPREQTWDDPLNNDVMSYDRVFEPIVMDGRLFVGFNDRDKLTAFDAKTGAKLWSYFAEGPVRLPPVGWNGQVYFCSDDGYLYCVAAADGRLQWKLSGAPNNQHAIGNKRLTSAWPARGGPVIRDGTVYFAASIWPFMGTFIYAVDAETGEVQWVNDSTGSQYIKQPHSAPSFAGVAPQGALVATDELLIVPGGRSVPAAFNRKSGEFRYFEINAGGKGTGGSFVAADEKHFYVHTRQKGTRAFDLAKGVKTAFMPNEPVLAGGLIYSAETKDEADVINAYRPDHELAWSVQADGTGDLILAGDHLYAAGKESIAAIRLPHNDQPARVVWSRPVDGQVERLLAADRKLFAVTHDGRIMAFGGNERGGTQNEAEPIAEPLDVEASAKLVVTELLASADAEGYAFWFGASDDTLIDALAEQSPFVQLAVVDDNATVVDRLRRRLDRAALYGRVTVHHSDARSFQPPQHVANLVFVGRDLAATADRDALARIYGAVRPYGGVMHLLAGENRAELAARISAFKLEQSEVELTAHSVLVRRVGALPGSADWTHLHGDVANTIKSNDSRVKLPLGILWFGGSSNADVLPRHGHGPPEQVIGGRLFIQGMNSLSARDVYTGRVLWKREFKDLGTFDVYYDSTYADTPLDPKYNQVHIPGANGRGTNYVVAKDRVYILEGATCHVLDPATGETLVDIALPLDESGERREWGYIGVYKDVLIGGLGFAKYVERNSLEFEEDKALTGNRAGYGSKSLDRAASLALIGFDRRTGEQLWKVDANHSFWHNGIVAGGGQVFCLDKNPKQIEDALRRRGKSSPDTYRILALDYKTGGQKWQVTDGIFGTWLGYHEGKDLLLQAGAAASDRLKGEVGSGMAVYSGKDGSLRWENKGLKYAGPCILHNELIITNANSYSDSAGAFRIANGEQKVVPNPVTGELKPWKLKRTYGCNNVIASENLLTFRSGAAGFYDLMNDSGTGNFGGFKSGCTSNLVVANGVLNAPDYTRTCSCAYQNQTSLALIHMPDLEMWTVNTAAAVDSHGKEIHKVGINFGAPGDRRGANGLLWIEYPIVAGDSPLLSIELDSTVQVFRHHASTMAGSELPWVLSSGVTGANEIRIGLKLQDEFNLSTGLPVSHVSDDAEENENGEVDLDSSDLELVDDEGIQVVGLRFNKINLSRNAKIKKAYLQFTCDEASTDPTSLIISAQASGDAARFSTDSHDVSLRPRTSAEVAWSPPAWKKGGAGGDQRTPDLAALLRQVVNRPDWKPGNSLAMLISGTGKRLAIASRGPSSKAARLIVEAEKYVRVVAESEPRSHRVRLFFGAPQPAGIGKSVFDVYLQDKRVIEGIEIDPGTSAVHTFEQIMIGQELRIRFEATQGQPLLSGIELIRDAS